MLEITTLRFALLGRFVRNESVFVLGENEQELAEAPSIHMFTDSGVIPTTIATIGGEAGNILGSDELDLNSNTKYLSQQLVACESYLKALSLTIRCDSSEL